MHITWKPAPLIVSLVPHEISRYCRYTSLYCANIAAEVKNICPKRTPTMQGGLEISMEMSVIRDELEEVEKMKIKLETVKKENYIDGSKDILN